MLSVSDCPVSEEVGSSKFTLLGLRYGIPEAVGIVASNWVILNA